MAKNTQKQTNKTPSTKPQKDQHPSPAQHLDGVGENEVYSKVTVKLL